ncbi:MAG: glycosyl transferase group 1 [Gemmatimonadetes bacterium]|nr:glycosyl transferase group 1 [Gemmatimonadota bacterium]
MHTIAVAPWSAARTDALPLAGQRVGLATPLGARGGDGIGYVAGLLDRAITELSGAPPRLIELGPKAGSLTSRGRFAAGIAAWQLSRRADWVLYNHVGLARAHGLVPRALALPYAVFVHGKEIWDAPLDASRRRALVDARLLVTNSQFTARKLREACPSAPLGVACPLALSEADAPGHEMSGEDRATLARCGAGYALIVGRLSSGERYKGHDQLIEAWPRVRARVPGARLVVAGGGDDLDRLRAKARAAGLAGEILFPGRVNDALLEGLFANARAFVMPSTGEGFGLVYLEAMRQALPCVGGTDDAAGEVIVDGSTGWLAPQRDIAQLANRVASLLENAELARSMGEAGRRRFERDFTFPQFRARIAAALTPVFGSRGRD